AGAIRDLRKSQDVLGDLHDRQVLIDQLPSAVAPENPDVDADHIRLVIHLLEAECRELHARYVSRRARLLEVCETTKRAFADRRTGVAAGLTVGAVALSSVLYAWHRGSSSNRRRPDEGAIRIPIGQVAPTP